MLKTVSPMEMFCTRIHGMMLEYGINFKAAVDWDISGFPIIVDINTTTKKRNHYRKYFLMNKIPLNELNIFLEELMKE